MVFSLSDSYTTLGATKIYGCWTQGVEKFDASSFYNYEQDNLPLFDLDERTYFLWEKAGYSPSTVNGVSLVVSANASNSVVGCNSNIFQSVSAAVRSLPEIIRFPVVIEIASFGNLGDLNLNGIQFTENGSLEIINRNAAKLNAYPDTDVDLFGIKYPVYFYTRNASLDSTYSNYKYPNVIESFDLSSTFQIASAISISATIFSSNITTDSRRTTGSHGYLMVPGLNESYPSTQMHPNERMYGMLGYTSFFVTSTGAQTFTFKEFSTLNTTEATPFDASCTDYVAGTEYVVSQKTYNVLIGGIYNNYFQSVKIQNCNGPVYIRNINVHGELTREYGFDIQNSTLFLDNCGAARCTKAGFNIVNSNITFLRGVYAYRNYGVATPGNGTTRLTGDYRAFVKNPAYERLDDAAGLKAINSNLLFSATSEHENRINAWYFGSNPHTVSANQFAIGFDRNYNGIHLINSNLRGIKVRSESNVYGYRDTGYFCANNNVNAGIKADNSNIYWDGRILGANNTKAIELNSSKLYVDNLNLRGNQRVGLLATNSEIIYNKNNYPNAILAEETGGLNYFAMWFSANGQHIILDNSILNALDTSALNAKFGTFRVTDNFWLNANSTNISGVGQSPAIDLRNGSYARLLGLYADRPPTKFLVDDPEKGSILAVKNGSIAKIQGSRLAPTIMVGNLTPAARSRRKYNAAVFAGQNSTVEINGPTWIDSFGVNLLAEENSTIKIGPHKDSEGNLDISGFTLSDTGNHTTVELRSQRSCIVVNKNSILDLQDLGDYRECWSRGALGTLVLTSGCDYDTRQTSGYTYRGSLQFYPNPVEDNYSDTASPGDSPGAGLFTTNGGDGTRNYFRTNNMYDPNNAYTLSADTLGGWCVRALENSHVNIKNVNFPAGWWNPSGVIYDVSGENLGAPMCNRLFLWNIADGSHLKANYISVSGLFPQDAGYFGPSSVWGSGAGAVAYGAPSGTPDTSSLSILDWYGGFASSVWPRPNGASKINFGFNPPENKGPFRLYVTTDPAADLLSITNGANEYGFINQLFAQGYNFSGNAYAASSVSSIYGSLVRFNGSTLVTSGFYYCSAFTPSTATQILLDESAANTFANAKNGASAKSGRPQICTIYLPYTSPTYTNSSLTKAWGKGLQSLTVFDLDKDN